MWKQCTESGTDFFFTGWRRLTVIIEIRQLWQKGLNKWVANVNYEVFLVHRYMVWHSFRVYSLSERCQYCDVDLFVLQLAVTLAIQELELIKVEPIVLVQLENVADKNENAYIEMLQKTGQQSQTKHYVKSMCCKFITEICKKKK